MEFLQSVGNWFISKFTDLANLLINILPDSPFSFISASPEFRQWLGWANYFFPLATFISIGEAWLTAISVYYLVQLGLRYAKAID